ncbi:uncharacterized protein BT62DRAFT_1081761 [Guyanagaster necrorhizus]|uniref:Uncharacterized protein n=1 Tax=Guyanagaster necrorhizus TaxID=856835 RepID=A0A9P7VED2_9AGAR|nr:uncharacterized protein BT62DRAFT_1081761 [Guyanagaster necrorhizus MCA 3950]KAG7439164.1 hypothetical protein BT62DRAFT_1081761 [Guyanagaster necrorhizus MCA 3950]
MKSFRLAERVLPHPFPRIITYLIPPTPGAAPSSQLYRFKFTLLTRKHCCYCLQYIPRTDGSRLLSAVYFQIIFSQPSQHLRASADDARTPTSPCAARGSRPLIHLRNPVAIGNGLRSDVNGLSAMERPFSPGRALINVLASVSCHCRMYLAAGTIDVYLTAGTTDHLIINLRIRLEVLHVDHPVSYYYPSTDHLLRYLLVWILRKRRIIEEACAYGALSLSDELN